MTRINKNIRNAVKRGTQYPAIITDIHGSRASARLSTNGATMHNLQVIGGPVNIGDAVSVDYTTPEPTIVSVAKSWLTMDDLMRELAKIKTDSGAPAITEYDKIIAFCLEDVSEWDMFSADAVGLSQARGMVADDVDAMGYLREWAIRLPPVAIEPTAWGNNVANFYLPVHVFCESSHGAELRGYVAAASSCTFENIHFSFEGTVERGQYPTNNINIYSTDPTDPTYVWAGDLRPTYFKNCRFRAWGYYVETVPETEWPSGFPYSNIELSGNNGGVDQQVIFEDCSFYARCEASISIYSKPKAFYAYNISYSNKWDFYLYNCVVDCGDDPIQLSGNVDNGDTVHSANSVWIDVPNIPTMRDYSILNTSDRSPINHSHGSSGSGGGGEEVFMNFVDLLDVPAAYTGDGNKAVAVKSTEDGLEFIDFPTSGSGADYTAIHDNISGEINAVAEKASPVDADILLIEDSEASNIKKKVQLGNLPAGATNFLALTDTPDDYTGQAGKVARVNLAEDALEFATSGSGGGADYFTDLLDTPTDYTGDGGKVVAVNEAETGLEFVTPTAASSDGWTAAEETWTYASADDPTYTFTITGDKTGKYSAGMRVKLTQTTDKYFIVTKVAYSDPSTTVTIYGGTDYDLANATITNPYFSTSKAPFGFPLDPLKWMVSVSDTSDRTQSNPTQNQWYNLGSITISIPIGCWEVSYRVHGYVGDTSGTSNRANITLSTANNSESDSNFTALFGNVTPSGSIDLNISMFVRKFLTLTSKTSYYLNMRTTNASMASINFLGSQQPTVIDALCAYL